MNGFQAGARCFWVLIILASLLTADVCSAAGEISENKKSGGSTKAGVLAGQVTRGPLRPVARKGQSNFAPAPGIEVLIYGPNEEGPKKVVTDNQGRFRISLPPGYYRIEIPAQSRMGSTRGHPATADISAGKETKVSLSIDTGIR